MAAVCVMVLGTSSGAGKSWLATALCRHYARQGLKVAPFKAQNMSNNARVVDGGEIGSAQYFQALAAGAEPEVRMNPVLLKPEADTHSQYVLMGRVDAELTALPWRERGERAWPTVRRALHELIAEHEVVVIEGAGSPAEINLMPNDIVNLRVAREAKARCLLVTDVDRGGAFAHLYGTWSLLSEADRALIRGFVLNKFRGDASLLQPGPQQLQDLTGVPMLGVIPMQWRHGLPEEDGVFDMTPTLPAARGSLPPEGVRFALGRPGGETDRSHAAGPVHITVAVLAWPRISNLDEFQPLKNLPGVRLKWVRAPADGAGADVVVLPGSKATAADLDWLREQGLDRWVADHAARGGRVLGVCGGLQVLGEALIDTEGIDGNAPGLGLLPLVTSFARDKTVRRTEAAFTTVRGPWAALSGVRVSGYEIHHGQTAPHPAMVAAGAVAHEVIPGLAWQNTEGNVLGLYLHGLFEDDRVLRALFGATAPTLETVFDRLADSVREHFIPGALDALIAP
ncbi:MAG: cobyric acid synthase [Hydrogenophaga sp.]|uniref:cobyric acid synthase n=1 Tax=Hydrogenophaga sp. TaxID=1904254 RepID=UPI0016BD5469|nr:cobyric acid synthase [Hydrogenophaga sp.]NIM42127.1 cobyric acid synthase [Hydrogenophaga sp.]NIN27422.1 cobyric acid synthase [Hydrogenophaga sp.]NIN32123.1 cobyric acid synthase [Hydrogenophaga sp.]NIN56281.1 cobyric acid synthase [Hydrogenophaga sp.]NIO52504.1 cobyric acid synthase [Hydrogenophaga sp.]